MEQDIVRILLRISVTKPLENSIVGLLGDGQGDGRGGGGFLGSIMGHVGLGPSGSTSSSSTSNTGLFGWLFGDSAASDAAASGSGSSSSSGGLLGWLFGDGAAAPTPQPVANATINAANVILAAAGAGGTGGGEMVSGSSLGGFGGGGVIGSLWNWMTGGSSLSASDNAALYGSADSAGSFGASGMGIGVTGGYAKGGAWSHGTRFLATGGIVTSPVAFGSAEGMNVAGEAGTEAVMPLFRAPDGNLGVKAPRSAAGGQTVNITQVISVAPDVSAVARAEIAKQLPAIRDFAVAGVQTAQQRSTIRLR